jgi:hypothetical protein
VGRPKAWFSCVRSSTVYSCFLAGFSVPKPEGSSGWRALRRRHIDLLRAATSAWEHRGIVVVNRATAVCTLWSSLALSLCLRTDTSRLKLKGLFVSLLVLYTCTFQVITQPLDSRLKGPHKLPSFSISFTNTVKSSSCISASRKSTHCAVLNPKPVLVVTTHRPLFLHKVVKHSKKLNSFDFCRSSFKTR